MVKPHDCEWLVPTDGSFRIKDAACTPPKNAPSKKELKKMLRDEVDRLEELQHTLYAQNDFAVLCVFQAMDAAGKDSTLRAVFSGVNPAGIQVRSFKRPSTGELNHDFLWRTTKALPDRGCIGVFNRSYYEEVLVVRVQPEILESQRLPERPKLGRLFEERYESIRDHEKHLARNGTVVLKFWLNVSEDEQARRLISRLEEPHKHWKFEAGDLKTRARWNDYMDAYERALNETSKGYAPWYAIPADDKPFMRWQVAHILRMTLEYLDLRFPTVDDDDKADFERHRKQLKQEIGDG